MAKVAFSQNFIRTFKKLRKKNRHLLSDIQALVTLLESDPKRGTFLGHGIYKIRMANSSKQIGKRAGFRVITYYVDADDEVYLVEMYEKNSIENIPVKELTALIEREFGGD
jgi:mRNA-degrading endonuclease RelE of RelBE toxin-antitoxin system